MSAGTRFKRRAMVALAVLSLFLGVTSTGWLLAVVDQWLLPWSTFKVFLPQDPEYMKMQEGKPAAPHPAGGAALRS
ncbi:hypothetical protein [Sphingobium sp. LB126]|uniref:hypothetical protein n=1 Tax=Sphingobium sp. LB126 TaxID=1983755 RepID=UPI0012FD9374|nr:hypothetical protein [Sphingobium sp. LB126]